MKNKKGKQKLFAEARRKEITQLIRANGSVSVEELSNHFSVSAATIRSDLRTMDRQGMLERTHGGAVSNYKVGYELNTAQKGERFVEEKASIAETVIRLINDGDTIAMDTGTTTFEVAKRLTVKKNLTIVTTDIRIASWLDAHTDFQILLAGGVLRKSFHCTSGSRTLDILGSLHLDIAIMATNGISIEKGLTTPSLEVAVAKTAMVKSAEKVIVICDHSKINHNAFVSFAAIDDVDILVTDSKADPEFTRALSNRGISIYS